MTENTYFVYILECENGTYYTGYTTDMARRYQEHLAGTAKCKYTRSFKPLRIAQYWAISGTKGMVLKVERYIKKMSKIQKEHLLSYPECLAEAVEELQARTFPYFLR